jgi:hypothetical protein
VAAARPRVPDVALGRLGSSTATGSGSMASTGGCPKRTSSTSRTVKTLTTRGSASVPSRRVSGKSAPSTRNQATRRACCATRRARHGAGAGRSQAPAHPRRCQRDQGPDAGIVRRRTARQMLSCCKAVQGPDARFSPEQLALDKLPTTPLPGLPLPWVWPRCRSACPTPARPTPTSVKPTGHPGAPSRPRKSLWPRRSGISSVGFRARSRKEHAGVRLQRNSGDARIS